ncbi:MAG: NAD-dependent epimerase/dehydratase family protein [Thermonemataceae bacterium]|nr:NAD-dependent epimerase/dehydratase family protein [Thermonemataceae bacterium]
MQKDVILVIGSAGQLGTELVLALQNAYGVAHVIAADVREPAKTRKEELGIFEKLDILNAIRLNEIVEKHKVTQIYHLAAMLSATGEKHPKHAWQLNMQGLINVLDIAIEKKLDKVYFPSSIAVFGPTTPPDHTPQFCSMEPTTVYGISKQAGEGWCNYYFKRYGVDVRSLRYPGLIGYKSMPGGGTTDYAVDIYHKALYAKHYECFLSENTYLPMMYMEDAIKATLDLMHADAAKISVRTSYNLSAMSFSPKEIAQSIQKFIPEFSISYAPDFRQAIADSWPNSIDDSQARKDWGWQPNYDLDKMTAIMLENIKIGLEKGTIV